MSTTAVKQWNFWHDCTMCVCAHRTSTNSNALICFSLCDPAQGNARIMKCWNMFEACFGWSQKRIQTVQDTNKFQQLCFLQLSPDSRTDVLLPIHAELYFNLSSTDTARGIVRYTGYNVFFFLTNYKYIVFVALCVLCCKRMESSTASLERKNHKQNY